MHKEHAHYSTTSIDQLQLRMLCCRAVRGALTSWTRLSHLTFSSSRTPQLSVTHCYYDNNRPSNLQSSSMSTAVASDTAAATAAATIVASSTNLVWIDCEMTGLNERVNRIIEIACVITDSELNVIATGFNHIIHQPAEVMADASQWYTEHMAFEASNMTSEVEASTLTTAACEQLLLSFIRPYIIPGKSPLCGNTVHADKRFLIGEFPAFVAQLHYRIIDVSTVKELSMRWQPNTFKRAPIKQYTHRALADIEESIAELKYYRQHAFAKDGEA